MPQRKKGIQTPDLQNEQANKTTKYEKFPLFAKVSLILAAICTVIYFISTVSEEFADFFNIYIAGFFRFLFAKITNIFPFSFAEILLFLSPILLGLALWYLLKFRCKTRKAALMSIVCIISAASLLFSSFVLTFSSGYRGTTLDKKLDLKQEPIAPEELYSSAVYLIDQINQLSERIEYGENDFSIMPYDLNTMSKKLIEAYDLYCDKHSFINSFKSKVKPIILSEAMSYAHTTGIYTFFTGEANINVDFPDYTIPYTAAHELAHQRGIARENEANFVAFLVTSASSDPYVRYSAYLNMLEYVGSALYRASPEAWRLVLATLPAEVVGELRAYAAFFETFRDAPVADLSDAVNDAYLKLNGSTAGTASYGLVVELAVAYYRPQK